MYEIKSASGINSIRNWRSFFFSCDAKHTLLQEGDRLNRVLGFSFRYQVASQKQHWLSSAGSQLAFLKLSSVLCLHVRRDKIKYYLTMKFFMAIYTGFC